MPGRTDGLPPKQTTARRSLPTESIVTALRRAGPSESPCRGQVWPKLNTERDAFTPSTASVDPVCFLAEASYVSIENREGMPPISYPELLCRQDVAEWLELRVGLELLRDPHTQDRASRATPPNFSPTPAVRGGIEFRFVGSLRIFAACVMC
jgi:hypothetical protein